jgi:hemoglobin
MTSLYEQLGGGPALDQAVALFYRRVLRDPRTAPFFDAVDMDRQAAKQKAFLTMVLGGPNNYTGKDMAAAHAPLLARGLSDVHVDVVIEHLGAVLKELGATEAQIAQVAVLANSVRDHVLGRAATPAE